MDTIIFFNEVRPLFGGKLTEKQVAGMENILATWFKFGVLNTNFLAKVLATAKWETARAMQPVKETQRPSDIKPPTDATVIKRLDAAFAKGQLTWVKKPYWRDGWFGRGLVQLTHEANYQGKIRAAVLGQFGVDIHAERDLVLRPDISAFILVMGMIEGWFTGKGLDDFIDYADGSDEEDLRKYMGARKIINGVDRAREIGLLALGFERALKKAGYNFYEPKPQSAPPSAPGGAMGVPVEKSAPDTVPGRPEAQQTQDGGSGMMWIVGGVVLLLILAAAAIFLR